MKRSSASLAPIVGALALLACADEKSASDSQPESARDAALDGSGNGGGDGSTSAMSFFVTSETNPTGDLGGLAGADARCVELADGVGAGAREWRAYLSAEHDGDGGGAIDARDRIGQGPWYNSEGVLLADDLDALHARSGDAEVFLDEHGEKIPGQWEGSPQPVVHDILTGSTREGRVEAGKTCDDWTSTAATLTAQVGHSDGLGPGMNGALPFSSWNSAHANGGCNNTAPFGGAGRIYCFAAD